MEGSGSNPRRSKNFCVALFGDSRHRWIIAGIGSAGTWLSRLAAKKLPERNPGAAL
jgi:hypothetical protein